MKRLVHTVALGAAVVALAAGIWRDYGAFTALKRAVIAYLTAYFLAGGLGLATRAALTAVRDPQPEPETTRSRRKRRPAKLPSAAAFAAGAPADPEVATEDATSPQAVKSG